MECGIGEYLAIAGLPTLTGTYLGALWGGFIVARGFGINDAALIDCQRVALLGTLVALPATLSLAVLALLDRVC